MKNHYHYSYEAYLSLFNRKIKGTSHPFYDDRYIRNYQKEIKKIQKGNYSEQQKKTKIRKLSNKKENRIRTLLIKYSLESHKFLTTESPLWELKKVNSKTGRVVYKSKNDACWKITTQYAQSELDTYFELQPRDRNYIVGGLKDALVTKSPITLIRCDIKKFYQTIDSRRIFETIKSANISELTKHVTLSLIEEYRDISGEEMGLPQGVALSSTLAELSIKEFDRNIQKLKGLLYYGRYVDDIVLVFNDSAPGPQELRECILNELQNFGFDLNQEDHKTAIISTSDMEYLSSLKKEFFELDGRLNKLNRELQLKMIHDADNFEFINRLNMEIEAVETRTSESELKISRYQTTFNYLGYKVYYAFESDGNGLGYAVGLPDSKIDFIISKMDLAFSMWSESISQIPQHNTTELARASKILLQRIKLISSNYKLNDRKSPVLVGLYGSYKSISEDGIKSLSVLDSHLERLVNLNISNLSESKINNLIYNELININFVNSFKNRDYFNASPNQISILKRGWM